MKLNDEIHINATREQVFAALNDTIILKRAIPGCEKIERISDSELSATVIAKVGPIKAKFKGQVTLSELNPPISYTISGEGQGGGAGFAKGVAKVSLKESGSATILLYEVKAEVGGKLAQLGGRLIDGTAKKLAAEFFSRFEVAVTTSEEKNADESNVAVTKKTVGIESINPLALSFFVAASLIILYFLIDSF